MRPKKNPALAKNVSEEGPKLADLFNLMKNQGEQLATITSKMSSLESWALALYIQVRSPLFLYPWIAIPLALILPIFRFAHRLIAKSL